MRIVVNIIILCIGISAFSQKQTAFWYFGNLAGLDFNSGNPVALTDSKMTTNEGCATISSYDGELLFYTDGITVWNRNHEIMLNGENLNGDLSSTNSAIVIPKPDSTGIYYIFTVDDLAGSVGLQYSEVDMSLDGNLGGITSRKNVELHAPTTEKITAVKHQNDTDWWVLAHKWDSNEFTCYPVTSSGIGSPVISDVGAYLGGIAPNSVGAMKFSPDGSKVAIANSYQNNHVQLFDFDNLTGQLSNPITISGFLGVTGNAYGVEFSLDSKLLYITDLGGSLYQFNTELASPTDIINSRTVIASNIIGLGAIQIAPNGKIYVARDNIGYLGVINSPNSLGLSCDYVNDGLYLQGRGSKLGLPPFIQSYFWKEITAEFTCLGDTTQFNIVNPEVSQVWDFDDPASGANNTSTLPNPTHVFSASGTYSVKVESTNFLGEQAITIINVTISEVPSANTPTDYIVCDNDDDGDAYNGIIQSFLLEDKDQEILDALNPLEYKVSYFEDSNFNLQIAKDLPYENKTANNQTVHAKLYNAINDECYDVVEFELIVNPVPEFDVPETKIVCSNRLPDQIEITNAQGNYDYEWTLEDGSIVSTSDSFEITSIDNIPQDGILLTVNATDPINNCTSSAEINLQKFEIYELVLSDIEIEDLNSNNTIFINPSNPDFDPDDYEFALDNTLGGIGTYQDSPFFEEVTPGIRTVYMRDKNGCDDSEIEISVIGFRKFFTPNDDGINDTWHILGVNEDFYASSIIRIYDRFGKILAKVDPRGLGWDGIYNNTELPETDYWFTVELIDEDGNIREYKGNFSLIRR